VAEEPAGLSGCGTVSHRPPRRDGLVLAVGGLVLPRVVAALSATEH
jgi:hypothetical protein